MSKLIKQLLERLSQWWIRRFYLHQKFLGTQSRKSFSGVAELASELGSEGQFMPEAMKGKL